MVIVLSGFNGIEGLVTSLYSSFDPDIKITAQTGKTFSSDLVSKEKLLEIEGVEYVSNVIEEISMVKNDDRWVTATMKGVEDDYLKMCDLGKLAKGKKELKDGNINKAIIGLGLQNQLLVSSNSELYSYVTVYGLLRNVKQSQNNKEGFKPEALSVGGVFNINPEFDHKYFIVPIDFAEYVLEYGKDISSVELGLKEGADHWKVKAEIETLLGNDFEVKTLYEQNELVFKTNETEKWMVFLILGFIMVLSTFNIIASLTMLILDKKKDIKTLISIGASRQFVGKIFVFEGLFINLLGALSGLVIGLIFCLLQMKFKFIKLQNAAIDYWPVEIEILDFVMIFGVIMAIAVISSYLPVKYLIKRHFKASFTG